MSKTPTTALNHFDDLLAAAREVLGKYECPNDPPAGFRKDCECDLCQLENQIAIIDADIRQEEEKQKLEIRYIPEPRCPRCQSSLIGVNEGKWLKCTGKGCTFFIASNEAILKQLAEKYIPGPLHNPVKEYSLTVLIRDPGPMEFLQEPCTVRRVTFPLTAEQNRQLELQEVGTSGGRKLHEQIRECFLEERH